MVKIRTIIISLCIVGLLINVVYFGFFNNTSDNGEKKEEGNEIDDPSSDLDQQGDSSSVSLELNKAKEITIGAVTHTITVISINGDIVTLIIESDPVEVSASLNIPKNVDTDDDLIYDIQILITSISDTSVRLTMTSILIPLDDTVEEDYVVHQPPLHIGDDYRYDFTIFAELYSENTSSGEYESYALNGNGQWDFAVYGPIDAESGFGEIYQTVLERKEADGSFTISIDSPDMGKVSVAGTFGADRSEYFELDEGTLIKVVNQGEMGVDQLPQAEVPVPIQYDGYVRTYPDPAEEVQPTIEELIYKDKDITLGDEGSIYYEGSDMGESAAGYYNWTAEAMENVAGFPSMRVNITRRIWGFLDFTETVWLSSNTPYPTRTFIRTNTSWEKGNDTGWIIFEQDRILTSAHERGSSPIPWENKAALFPEKHPGGEFLEWDMIPRGGYKFDNTELSDPKNPDLAVQFAPDAALEYLLEVSPGMSDFELEFPDSLAIAATYNATLSSLDPQNTAGSHYWNITLADYMSEKELKPYYEDYQEYEKEHEDEDIEEKEKKRAEGDEKEVEDEEGFDWPEHIYTARIAKNITKNINPLNPYSAEVEMDKDYGRRDGWIEMKRSDLDDEGCTLSGAVDVVAADEMAREELFDRNGNLDMREQEISISKGATTENMPGIQIIQQITGIVMPSASYGWIFWKGSVYEQGDMFSAAVDVETGRQVYVMKISGTALMGLFGK